MYCIVSLYRTVTPLLFNLYLFREGSTDSLFQGHPEHTHSYTYTPGSCPVQPLSSSTGATGVRSLAQGPSEVEYGWGKQFPSLSPPTQILLVGDLNQWPAYRKLASPTIRPPPVHGWRDMAGFLSAFLWGWQKDYPSATHLRSTLFKEKLLTSWTKFCLHG